MVVKRCILDEFQISKCLIGLRGCSAKAVVQCYGQAANLQCKHRCWEGPQKNRLDNKGDNVPH